MKIYTDGASRGNPGESAAAFVVVNRSKPIFSAGFVLGEGTNNEAEYKAIIFALKYAVKEGYKKVRIISDSKVVTSQITGAYKTKSFALSALLLEVKRLAAQIDHLEVENVRRTNQYIKVADSLCNGVLDLTRRYVVELEGVTTAVAV